MSVPNLNIIGGGAQLAALPQLLANVFGIHVATLSTETKDATSPGGAAINAGVGVGIFTDFHEGVQAIRTKATYCPSPEKTRAYERLFSIYTALYPNLKPVFAAMRNEYITTSSDL